MESDADLVTKALAGDLTAFGLLVRRYERLVRATALNICRDSHAADDVAQEAFLAAFETLVKLQHAEKFGGWVLSIARHKALHHVRESGRREVPLDEQTSVASADNGRLDSRLDELLSLVEKLPHHERIVVGLKHFGGHTAAEIGEITGSPVGTVTKQLSRAYDRLKQWAAKEVHR